MAKDDDSNGKAKFSWIKKWYKRRNNAVQGGPTSTHSARTQSSSTTNSKRMFPTNGVDGAGKTDQRRRMSPSESGGSSLGDSTLLHTQSLRAPPNRMLLEEDSNEELRGMHQRHESQLNGVTSEEEEGMDGDNLSDDNSFGPSSSYGDRSASYHTSDPQHHLTTTNTTTSATPTTSSSHKHNGIQPNTSGPYNGSKSAISSPSLSANPNRRSFLGGPTDDASVLTLASSSKLRGRRKSIDTDASVRAIAPHSRKSLDLLDDEDGGSGRSRGAAMGSGGGGNMNGFSRTGSMGGESSLKAGSIAESIPPRSTTTKTEQRISVPDIASF